METANQTYISRYGRLTNMERCKNPWNDECKNNEIELYILFRGEKRPICRRCWTKMSDKDQEW